MKTIALAAVAAALVAGPALAQEHNHAATASASTTATATVTEGLSVEKTLIGDIVKNEQAKAVLEKALPQIPQFYDQIGAMTLTQVAPMSQGAIDDAKLKEIQAEFDKIK